MLNPIHLHGVSAEHYALLAAAFGEDKTMSETGSVTTWVTIGAGSHELLVFPQRRAGGQS